MYKRQEQWLAGAPDVYARGRTRMTRDLTGVQTWHDYAATTEHLSLIHISHAGEPFPACGLLLDNGKCLAAVSYTPLDVYKRQL